MGKDKLKITPKPRRGDDGYRTFSIRIREEAVAKIDEIASISGRSRNELIGMFIDYAIKNCEIEK